MDRNGHSVFVTVLRLRVALRKESVDRNRKYLFLEAVSMVALRKESVDRNISLDVAVVPLKQSLSARRAWIEMQDQFLRFRPRDRRSPQGERG